LRAYKIKMDYEKFCKLHRKAGKKGAMSCKKKGKGFFDRQLQRELSTRSIAAMRERKIGFFEEGFQKRWVEKNPEKSHKNAVARGKKSVEFCRERGIGCCFNKKLHSETVEANRNNPKLRAHWDKLKGENNPAKCPEVRKKISDALKGRKFSIAHKAKLRESCGAPEARRLASLRMKGRKVTWGDKVSRWRKRFYKENPVARRKLSEAIKRAYKEHPEYGKKISESRRGRKATQTTKEKLSKALKMRWKDPIQRNKFLTAIKKLWQDEEFRKKTINAIMYAQNIKPNIPERKLIRIIRDNNFPFIYVGDGAVVIEGFCPDFIDNNGSKRIIEVFGDYWHRLPRAIKRDEKRLKVYEKYGFKTLVIWVNELKDEEQVVNRIKEVML